jgi:hypothetical protein
MFVQLVFDTIYWIFGYAAGVLIQSIGSLALQLVF